jgi:hypothetical protein
MKRIVLAGLILFIANNLSAQNLFVVFKNGQWGYIDSTGKEVIPPTFKVAGYFYEGLAYAVLPGGKMGYINPSGINMIKPKYEAGTNFNEGFASVLEDEDWGIINSKGEMVVEPKFASYLIFHNGLAKFKQERGLFSTYGFIDTKGDTVIYPKFDKASDFSDGLCMASTDGNKYGYIDTKGNWVIEPAREIGAYIKINKEYDFRDKNFSEGLVAFVEKEKYGVMDKTGKTVIPAKFESIGKFSMGLAPAKMGGLFGYIDTKGEWVIKPKYKLAEAFSNGLAAVALGPYLDEKWGFINTAGKVVIPLTLLGPTNPTEPLLFMEGAVAAYLSPGVWGYVNRSGKVIWKNK